MATYAVQTSRTANGQLRCELRGVPRDRHSTDAQVVTLKLVTGPDDDGEAVITIM